MNKSRDDPCEQLYPKAVTPAQSRQIDMQASDQLGIPGIVLMENAALNATNATMDLLRAERGVEPFESKIFIFCGGGNNGGDGYAMARHLHNWGADVKLFAYQPLDKLTGDAATNANICRNLNLPIQPVREAVEIEQTIAECEHAHAVVDALLGTGFDGAVRKPLAGLIKGLNEVERPVRIALDIPSGLNGLSGKPDPATFRADMTISFVSEKVGFRSLESRDWLGHLVVADIGIPNWLIDQVLGHPDSTRVQW